MAVIPKNTHELAPMSASFLFGWFWVPWGGASLRPLIKFQAIKITAKQYFVIMHKNIGVTYTEPTLVARRMKRRGMSVLFS